MRRALTCLIGSVLLLACGGEEATPTPNAETRQDTTTTTETPEAADTPSPEPTEPAATPSPPPTAPPPTAEQVAEARETCNSEWSRFIDGPIDTSLSPPENGIDRALAVLRRAEGPAIQRALGACLYNRGRIAEERLDIEGARAHYDESLEARPNATVRRRRGALGTREVYADEGRYDAILGMLRRDEQNPCSRRCPMEVQAASRSGARRLLRTAVVAVWEHGGPDDDEPGAPSLYVAWGGPTGTYHWGPRIYHPTPEMGTRIQSWLVDAAPRPLRAGEPWHLVVRYTEEWQERCCGGRSEGYNGFVFVCELGETEARCLSMVESTSCSGGPDDPSHEDDYAVCEDDDRNRITFDEQGLEISGRATLDLHDEPGLRALEVGRYAWTDLFPPAEAPANEGAANEGAANEGAANEGAANEGAANEGAANEGAANEGAANEGAANEGAATPTPTPTPPG